MPADYTRQNPRHRIMVEYTAYGKSPAEIADATGYSEGYVKAVQRSPLFLTEVANVQDEVKRHTLSTFAEKLAEETMPSLTTLTGIRDNTNARDTDRVSAADKIIGRALDLYLPRGREDDGKRTVKLVIEGGDLGALANAIREVDGKGAMEVHTSAPAQITDDNEVVRPVTIEEMVAADRNADGEY